MDGSPQIILFDITSAAAQLDEYKRELYENTKIGIPSGDVECNDAVLFGYMVAKFIEEVGDCVLSSEVYTQVGYLYF